MKQSRERRAGKLPEIIVILASSSDDDDMVSDISGQHIASSISIRSLFQPLQIIALLFRLLCFTPNPKAYCGDDQKYEPSREYHGDHVASPERRSRFSLLKIFSLGSKGECLPPSFLTPAPPRLRRVGWVIGWRQATLKTERNCIRSPPCSHYPNREYMQPAHGIIEYRIDFGRLRTPVQAFAHNDLFRHERYSWYS